LAQAIKVHAAFRKSKGDPRVWKVYTPVLGDNLNMFVIRSCCFEWAGLDSYEKWGRKSQVSQHWNKTADQFVAKYIHNLHKWDMSNSHWPKDVEHKFVGLTSYKVKLGHWRAMKKDREMMSKAAIAEKWPYQWAWGNTIAGEREQKLAVAYKDYSAMEPPEKSFSAMLTQHMGDKEKAKELLTRWSSHFDKITYNIYRLRADLTE